MKLATIALAALCVGASVADAADATILVTHELDAARPAEIVVVPFAQIAAIAPALRMYHVVVRDAKGRALPLQITNYQHDHRGAQYDDLVFMYDFAAGEKRATFTIEAVATATPPDAPCVYARMVPERFDDVAWENDRIAHRMYGFALNTPAAGGERLRGSGIDVWAKRVSFPVVDRWYAKGHDQFHKDDEGEGLDLYSIGGSRGAGGTGVWDGTKLWTSDNFVDGKVLSNGPRRAAFKLNYAPFDVGAQGQRRRDQTIHRRLRAQLRYGRERVRFTRQRSRGRYWHQRTSGSAGLSRGGADARPGRPLDELLGREPGRRARRRRDPRE